METRHATKITVRLHAYKGGPNNSRVESYITDYYEVGKEHKVPDGDSDDEVVAIRVVSSWKPHVEIEYKDWGKEWINDFVISIEFKDERYTDILREKRAAREGKNT